MIPKSVNRFSDQMMRHFWRARDRTQNRCPLLLVAREADAPVAGAGSGAHRARRSPRRGEAWGFNHRMTWGGVGGATRRIPANASPGRWFPPIAPAGDFLAGGKPSRRLAFRPLYRFLELGRGFQVDRHQLRHPALGHGDAEQPVHPRHGDRVVGDDDEARVGGPRHFVQVAETLHLWSSSGASYSSCSLANGIGYQNQDFRFSVSCFQSENVPNFSLVTIGSTSVPPAGTIAL